jgi:sulfatase maturation enzyme AslB (radical SAM superfamily)
MVVITPDNNVYPCLFLVKPGLEIGKYINDKILLKNKIDNDGDLCLAQELCNKSNNKVLSKILKI